MRNQEIQTVKKLFQAQLAYFRSSGKSTSELAYIYSKFEIDITLERQLRVIDMFAPYIRGRVLDWGCHFGFDSCVLRMRFGNAIELLGCDVLEETLFRPFYEFSGIRYSQLGHPYRLDYEDNHFDVVLSNGVLEHVPEDRLSIREIFRILKPSGTFIVTCLPNRYSYTEAFQRLRKGPAHDRLYTIRGARRLLQEAGFEVLAQRYFFVVPTMLGGLPSWIKQMYCRANRLVWQLNDVLESCWPINRLSSNFMIVARKPNFAITDSRPDSETL